MHPARWTGVVVGGIQNPYRMGQRRVRLLRSMVLRIVNQLVVFKRSIDIWPFN